MDETQFKEIYDALVATLVELGQIWIVYQVEEQTDEGGSQDEIGDTGGQEATGYQQHAPTTSQGRLNLLLDAIEHAAVTSAAVGEEAFNNLREMGVNSITFASANDSDASDAFVLNAQVVDERNQISADLMKSLRALRGGIKNGQ